MAICARVRLTPSMSLWASWSTWIALVRATPLTSQYSNRIWVTWAFLAASTTSLCCMPCPSARGRSA